jgi:hypothetical protein
VRGRRSDGLRRGAPEIAEPQAEAIGFAANGASRVTIGEGAGAVVHRFTVRPPLRG